MQTILQSVRIVIQEIAPVTFASLCNEAHPAILVELGEYFKEIVENNRGVLLAAFNSLGQCIGRVCVEISPRYVNHGKPCATFGWLDGDAPEVVNALLNHASEWASRQVLVVNGKNNRNALLRGPISLPKMFGGVGCQVKGFSMPRMYGESANRPELGQWIETAGFKQDASYACLDVTKPEWKSAGDSINGFTIVTLTANEWHQREDEVAALLKAAFGDFLPDTIKGRFIEMLDTIVGMSNSMYLFPTALDQEGQIAGFILGLPNLYEAWDGKRVSSVNVDTVLISPKYRGHDILSALHNKGIVGARVAMGDIYLEGTAIWFANENAVKTFFPHGTLVRKHVVFQKRLKRSTNGDAC